MWQSLSHFGYDERPAISVALGRRDGSSYISSSECRHLSHNDYKTRRDHTYRLPGKLALPKQTVLNKTIKAATTPLTMKPMLVQPTPMATDTPLLLAKCQLDPPQDIKPIEIKDLRRKQILLLRENYEGNLCWQDVSAQDLDDWKLENPDLLEAKDIRYEYNFLTERFIIKCMPTATHDSLQEFFMQNVFGTLIEKVGFLKAKGLVQINSGTTFGGFKGDWTGSSEKEPDAYIKLNGSDFPSMVCEAGWSETLEHLIADARLWLLNTGGITRVVIVVCITETNSPNTTVMLKKISKEAPAKNVFEDVSAKEVAEGIPGEKISEAIPDEILEDVTAPGISNALTEEQALIEAITTGIDLNSLAEKLRTLNAQAKLKKPLVGNLTVTIHVYQACEDQADIKETFSETVIPAPPVESEAPREFKITFKDIFGDNVPAGVNPTDSIIFGLAELQEFVTRSLRDTEWLRATRRARKLLKEAGEWEEADTFAQHKRRRHGGGSLLKEAGEWQETDTFVQHKRRRQGGGV